MYVISNVVLFFYLWLILASSSTLLMPMKRLNLFVLIALQLFLFKLTAQLNEHPVRMFTKESGFLYDLKTLVQDQNDFIWLSYKEGIQRFDGNSMETFFEQTQIYSLLTDAQGVVWASTKLGVFRFDYRTNKFKEVTAVDKSTTKLLFVPQDAPMAFVSDSGIYEYNTTSNEFKFKYAIHNPNDSSPHIQPGYFSVSGNCFFYRVSDTIFRRELGSDEKQFVNFYSIRSIKALNENEIVVSNWENKSWYYNFSNQRKLPLQLSDDDSFFIIFDALHKSGTSYFLATFSGLFLFDTVTEKLTEVNLSLDGNTFPQQRINALYKGKDQAIWAGLEAGLIYINDSDKTFHFIKSQSGSRSRGFTSDVRNFAEVENGKLWLATTHGLTLWDTEKNAFNTILARDGATDWLNHASIRGLVYDGTYLIVGQTNKGMWLYDPQKNTFKRPNFEPDASGQKLREKLERDFINQIKTLQNGDHLIVARDGAYILNGNTYTVTALEFPGQDNNVKFSYQDRNGTIFIGTLKGLYCLNEAYEFQFKIEEELENAQTFCLLEYGNDYFLGTNKGLYVFSISDGQPWVNSYLPELKDESVKALFTDAINRLWIVGKSKVYVHHPEENSLSVYGYAENIRGDFYYINSYFRNEKGMVFLGSTNGISFFYPEKIDISPTLLKPIIKAVRLPEANQIVYPDETKTRIKNRFRNLEIDFIAPYFGDTRDIQYNYRLSEDGPWYHHGNQTRLMLWELPPGDYTFQLAASRNNEKWFLSPQQFRFTIAPPFWKTGWFLLLSLLIIGVMTYYVIVTFREKLKIETLANTFATSLYGQNTVDGILWDIARNCVKQLGFVDCVVYLLDDKRNVLIQKAAFGPKNPYGKEITNLMEIPVGKGIVGSVAVHGLPELVKDTQIDPRYLFDYEQAGSEIAVPVFVDGKVFAVIDSEHPKKNYFKAFHLKVLLKVAAICSERMTKYLSEERLRSKIARDLHDEMGSTLSSINITSKIAEQDIVNNEPVKKQLRKINLHTRGMLEKMSDMVWVINPANDNFKQVMYRIKEYAIEISEPAGISLAFSALKHAEHIKLNPEQRKNIYLIAKEAINNAVKYSGATALTLQFETTLENRLKMTITDNGQGFDVKNPGPGNGIKNMRFRAEEIGAGFQIETSNGNGTSIALLLPHSVHSEVE